MENKITKEMRDMLRAPLPPEAITQHPTKKYLSSIKAIYIIERLNDVFGMGEWTYNTHIIETNKNGTIIVQLFFNIEKYKIKLESFGGNDNGGVDNPNFDLGDAYKGATTDALTKVCSYLEIGIDVFKGKCKGMPTSINTPTPTPTDSSFGNCANCGAPNRLSKQNKPYCSALCWNKVLLKKEKEPTPTPTIKKEELLMSEEDYGLPF